MVIAADTSIFSRLQNFPDYQRAQEAFQLQKAVQQQALQTGGIDAATKANIYKTQVISAAVASGNPDDLSRGLQALQANNIDVSDVPKDLQGAAQWAQAGRLAQSPLGSLLNAGTKMTANDLAAVTTYGSMDAAKAAGYKPEGAQIPIFGGSFGGGAPAPAPVAPPPAAPAAAPRPAIAPQATGEPTDAQFNALFPPQPESPAPQSAPVTPPPAVAPAASIPKFTPPMQQQGESIAAYNSRVQQAFEAYKTSPEYLRSAAVAGDLGKAGATAQVDAIKSQETAGRLQPNFNALRAINNDVPDSTVIPADWKAALSTANPFGDHKAAQAMAAWNMVNEQQVLNALGQLVAGGQIRSNRQIAKMLETGNFVPSSLAAPERLMLINTLENESKNQATSATNIANRLNGGTAQPYTVTIPSQGGASSQPPQGAALYGTSGGKNVYKMPDGSFIMEQ